MCIKAEEFETRMHYSKYISKHLVSVLPYLLLTVFGRRHCVYWSSVQPFIRCLSVHPFSVNACFVSLYLLARIQRNLAQIFAV